MVPSFTFYATAEAVVNAGARPVFCDVDPDTRNVTPTRSRAALTPHGRARSWPSTCSACPAPLPGDPGAWDCPVLEDAAQAAGASLDGRRAGALGDVATFSFYPSKNLGCFGDGGAIATDDDEVAEQARALRFHGSHDKQTFEYVGYNSRLDELQAAILRVLLPRAGRLVRRAPSRRPRYCEPPASPSTWRCRDPPKAPNRPGTCTSSPTREPDALLAALGEHGIQARGYYRTPLHRQPAMRPYADEPELPATEELARTNLALPMGPMLGRSRRPTRSWRRSAAAHVASAGSR